jgi:hypothetical protein
VTKEEFDAGLHRICEEFGKPFVANFFDNDVVIMLDNIQPYMESHTPSEMLTDIRGSGINPNELPSLGDQALQLYKQYAHSQVLYAEGIRQLEAVPHLLAPDCNLLFARRNLCVSYYMLGSAAEAFSVIAKEPKLIAADVATALLVTRALAQNGRSEEANMIVSAIGQIPLPELLSKLEAAELDFDFVNDVKAEVRKASGVRTMRDLNWLSASGAGELPEGLLDMDVNQLAKNGVPIELLNTIKTAVLLQSGQDRKMWSVAFFDINDPRPLLARGMAGRFRVLFHCRMGKYGEGCNVFGIYND